MCCGGMCRWGLFRTKRQGRAHPRRLPAVLSHLDPRLKEATRTKTLQDALDTGMRCRMGALPCGGMCDAKTVDGIRDAPTRRLGMHLIL